MHPTDRTILAFCQDDFQLLKPLDHTIPHGSLYRHVKDLVAWGWLEKARGRYRTTEAGRRQLVDEQSGRRWEGLAPAYPPLALVPTPVHRAMSELIVAAVVARQHGARPDRHPFFVAFGGTLHWKTSLGVFCCHALGLDPAVHVVDCGSESGRSLAVRRSSTGTLVFKRELLDGPFVVLDEVVTASPAVRATLGCFLSGRLTVPFENTQLAIRPVPFLTLNPKDATTLETRIGLSAPQIRRGILANLDAVAMPDLATGGERALAAARDHGPLARSAPAVDCRAHHRPIVELARALLVPEAHDRVDVEILVNLCTGMTAFLRDPGEAIAQVGYDLGLLTETVGWTRPGWITAVTEFSVERMSGSPTRRATPPPTPEGSASPLTSVVATPAAARPSAAVSLQVPPRPTRKVECPDLSLSADLRARLVWFAFETQRPVETALASLLDFYLQWRDDETDTLGTFARILELGQELDLAEIDGATLHDDLQTRATLAAASCTIEDVPEALRLIALLDELGGPWSWPQLQTAVEALAALMDAGIGAEAVATFLARHQRLAALGFDEATAEAIATALVEAGATDGRREAIIRAVVEQAGLAVDRVALDATLAARQAELAALERERGHLRDAVRRQRTQLRQILAQEAAAQTRLAQCQAEGDARRLGSAVVPFLTQRTPEAVAFWSGLQEYWRARQAGRSPEAPELAHQAATLLGTFCAWVATLLPLVPPGPPDPRPQGGPTGA
jgi:hypothetical protein